MLSGAVDLRVPLPEGPGWFTVSDWGLEGYGSLGRFCDDVLALLGVSGFRSRRNMMFPRPVIASLSLISLFEVLNSIPSPSGSI